MHLVVLSNEALRKELLAQDKEDDLQITWINEVNELLSCSDADMILDLLFENRPERVVLLQRIGKPVVINSVTYALAETDTSFIRINGWPGFLTGALVEASGSDEQARTLATAAFEKLGKEICWVPDQAGFITARVVASIINEAFFALSEAVSTKAEIDTAMKLGTNYPYGPFEWAAKIGLSNVATLLQKLEKEQPRYAPCPLLVQEAGL